VYVFIVNAKYLRLLKTVAGAERLLSDWACVGRNARRPELDPELSTVLRAASGAGAVPARPKLLIGQKSVSISRR
jgi:hypothetical protein